jgi:hypothetical protein
MEIHLEGPLPFREGDTVDVGDVDVRNGDRVWFSRLDESSVAMRVVSVVAPAAEGVPVFEISRGPGDVLNLTALRAEFEEHERLQWSRNNARVDDLARFYSLLRRLESGGSQGRPLADYTGYIEWPARGVYFFRESGETRRESEELRVVRVGTHALHSGAASKLWQRLRSHRGGVGGGGNHRGSILRQYVGDALLKKGGITLPSWGNKTVGKEVLAGERDLEKAVSQYIGAMSVLWLEIDDEPGPTSDRARIEEHAIGLLSGISAPLDPPSPTWLGLLSEDAKIRDSGLWNKDYVFGEYDPRFLDVMEQHVHAHCQKMRRPSSG